MIRDCGSCLHENDPIETEPCLSCHRSPGFVAWWPKANPQPELEFPPIVPSMLDAARIAPPQDATATAAESVRPRTEPHRFSDHQHCLKCGKSETAPDADDCTLTDHDFEAMVRRGEQPEWRRA